MTTDKELLFKLANGASIPAIGLGTWQLPEKQSILEALKFGYRHIDTAAIYDNEKTIGQVLKETFAAGSIKRSDIFITSKLWNTHHHPSLVEVACNRTLSDLGLDYVDLYLIHWPFSFVPKSNDSNECVNDANGHPKLAPDASLEDTWRAMEQLVDKGKVKAIGISNFTIDKIERLLKIARIPIACNQVELHPFLPQNDLVKFCHEHKIVVTAYSLLGSGKSPSLLKDETILQVAKDENLTPAQVLISWAIQRGTVAIPKSTSPVRLAENLNYKTLSDASMKKVNALEARNVRYLKPREFWGLECF